MARRKPQPLRVPDQADEGVPADLAAGPCIEIWADPDDGFAHWSARRRWREARDHWARLHGLTLPRDYRHLPRELRDRAPFRRSERTSA